MSQQKTLNFRVIQENVVKGLTFFSKFRIRGPTFKDLQRDSNSFRLESSSRFFESSRVELLFFESSRVGFFNKRNQKRTKKKTQTRLDSTRKIFCSTRLDSTRAGLWATLTRNFANFKCEFQSWNLQLLTFLKRYLASKSAN